MRMYVGAVGDRYCDVLLDGEKIKDCIVADDDEGWVIGMSVNERGNIIVDPDYTEGVRTEFRYGDVALVFDPPIWRERAAEGLRQERRGLMQYTVVVTALEPYTRVTSDYYVLVEAESVIAAAHLAEQDVEIEQSVWAFWDATAVYAGWLVDLLPDDYVSLLREQEQSR